MGFWRGPPVIETHADAEYCGKQSTTESVCGQGPVALEDILIL